MGRYIGTGSAQPNTCSNFISTTCYQVSTHKYSYDGNSCWNNRVLLDSPGNYTFTVPSNATCFRVVAVGGGGKAKCTNTSCSGYAGAGGGYSERVDAVAAGCTVTIVVGRQEQDTTISYTNTGAVARTVTGGGAAGCIPGQASGGDWNSTGGVAGKNCNYCGGSYSHYCGSCIYFTTGTCCGYCVVYGGISIGAASVCPDHGSNDCCNARYAGGGSAGSWIWSSGGAGQDAQNNVDVFGSAGSSGGATAGGGGGIGYIIRQSIRSSPCNCITGNMGGSSQYGPNNMNACYPAGAGGGGGTKWQPSTNCECFVSTGIECQLGMWWSGRGGWGGYDNNEGVGDCFMWGCYGQYCSNYAMCQYYYPAGLDPIRYPWHDIHNMCGSGSAGRNIHIDNTGFCTNNQWAAREDWSFRPANAGEGAGTGGVVFVCCDPSQHYSSNICMVNWVLVCCLGLMGKVCCSDRLTESLTPNFISCAGTLGGSGGVGICNYASKAGKGGGGGVYRCYIHCICWGNSTYDTYGGDGVTPLAYPACELDWRISNAGSGMAILYWKS